jgi:excisionase family DNA binding protein
MQTLRSKTVQTLAAPAEPLLITVKQAGQLLSVSTSEIRILCRKGLLAYRKLGETHWLVSMRSVRAYAEGAKAAA